MHILYICGIEKMQRLLFPFLVLSAVHALRVPRAPVSVQVTCHLNTYAAASVTFEHYERGETEIPSKAIIEVNPQRPDFPDMWEEPIHSSTRTAVPVPEVGMKFKDLDHFAFRPYGDYRVRVRTVNSMGKGPAREANETCHSPAARPTRTPIGVKAVGTKPGSMVVSWEPMDELDKNGKDFKYVVYYAEKRNNADPNEPLEWHKVETRISSILNLRLGQN